MVSGLCLCPCFPAGLNLVPDFTFDARRQDRVTGLQETADCLRIRVGYHNHAWELESTIEDKTALEGLG